MKDFQSTALSKDPGVFWGDAVSAADACKVDANTPSVMILLKTLLQFIIPGVYPNTWYITFFFFRIKYRIPCETTLSQGHSHVVSLNPRPPIHLPIMSPSPRSVWSKPAFMAALALLLLPCPAHANPAESNNLSVYPHVPGLDPSPHYRFQVRELKSNQWLSPFAFMTRCGEGGAYYNRAIGGWTHTYCNFEMGEHVPVEVEITRLDPATGKQRDIQAAVPHPRHKVRSWRVENGKAYVIFEKPALFAIDIDGQMDDNPLPRNPPSNRTMTGANAVHALTIFANPFIKDKPDLKDPTVFAVEPGTIPPKDGDWKTLYFKPGVHQLWEGTWKKGDQYEIRSGKQYYIPGDALVHGNFLAGTGPNSIRVFGHGTLTQERITHALHQKPPLQGKERGLTSAMKIGNAAGTTIEGITITDSPDHSVWLQGNFNPDPATFNYIRWVKVMTWRANGDGITVDENDFLEDSFVRVQDDGTYLKGRSIRRMVYWTDCNGRSLKVNMLTRDPISIYKDRKLLIEDIDIIYGRTSFPLRSFHSVLGGRHDFPGPRGSQCNDGSYIVFRNIHFSDPMPLRKLIGYSIGGAHRRDLKGIRFENLRATAPSLTGTKNSFHGRGDGKGSLRNFVLDDVVVGGRQITSTADLEVGAVENMMFENTSAKTSHFTNQSGYGKWYMRNDWSAAVEPADHDHVKHTSQAGTLTVDCPAWAGTLEVAHAGQAAVRLEYSGRLFVSDTLTLGNSVGGKGKIELTAGELVLRKPDANALHVANGTIHMEKNGLLLWAGKRFDTVRSLFDAKRITLGESRKGIPEAAPYDRVKRAMLAAGEDDSQRTRPASPVMIGQIGDRVLFADFDNINPGFTTCWVGEPWCEMKGGITTSHQDENGQSWRVHTFTKAEPDAIEVTKPGAFEYLIVGGGGGGGGSSTTRGGGAGGGAGGFIQGLSRISTGTQPILVGGGGTAGASGGGSGGDGGESSAFGIVAPGGGGGAGRTSGLDGRPGGSGGGGDHGKSGGASLPTPSSTGDAGCHGGNWKASINGGFTGPGGGGAGGGGGDGGSSARDGNGGIGRESAFTCTRVHYAGGGGGGRGWNSSGASGTGGTGGGGTSQGGKGPGGPGSPNTGGGGAGGGGHGTAFPGGPGGSGIIVVRYQITPPGTPSPSSACERKAND